MKILFKDGIGQWSETEGYDVPKSDKNPLILRYSEVDGVLVDNFPGQSNEEVIAIDVAQEKQRVSDKLKLFKETALKHTTFDKIKEINVRIERATAFGNPTDTLLQEKEDIKTRLNILLSAVQAATTEEELINIRL